MLRIPEHGRSVADVQEALAGLRTHDVPWREGRTFGYVYEGGGHIDEVAQHAYMSFLYENGLDPTEFKSLLHLENEVVAMCIDHLRGDEQCVGNFTSGGTESIMLGVKAARDRFRVAHPDAVPEMVLPRTAHAAFHKSAHYLGLKVVITEVDGTTFRAVPDAMRAACNENTALLVGSATGYAHGVVDPIPEIAAIGLERDIPVHVDGCIGAFVLPFFRELGVAMPDFDLSVPGVTSISMDLHKYAFCPKGASVILHRSRARRAHQVYVCAQWSGYVLANAGVQSSKSGGPLAAAWSVLQHVGRDGYRARFAELLDTTRRIVAGVGEIEGLEVLGQPEMALIAIASTDPQVNVYHLSDLLGARGWHVQPQLRVTNSPANLHLTLTPGHTPHIEGFLEALAACTEEARRTETPAPPEPLLAALQQVDLSAVDEDTLAQLLGAAGIGEGGALPAERCVVNQLLDAMPLEARNRVLRFFFNGLFVPAE